VLILDMIEVLPPLGKYKYNTQRILLMKCYIDNSVRLWSCVRNVNRGPLQLDPPSRRFQKTKTLLEKRFIVTPAIHFWYALITVDDTKNELLFLVLADLINRYKNTIFRID
jgi:hypothetical protein